MNRRKFLAGPVVLAASLASLASVRAQRVDKFAEDLKNGEYNWFPDRSADGPLLIIVSIPDQLLHVYRNGIRVAASTCSTGKPGHRTPAGVFKILEKDKHHRSSTYSNAPMPNMNRLTWSGIALHAGNLPGYPASHGCVRLPMGFSELLFQITRKGMTVVIADERSQPSSVVHPGMVLGEYARHEFGAVDAALKRAQYSEGHKEKPHTSVVVSARNKTATVWDDGRIVATGKVSIRDGDTLLGKQVYSLKGSDASTGVLSWSGTGYGKSDRLDMTKTLRRIEAEPSLREHVRKRLHHGMTIVTTDDEHTAQHRASDFTIIDGIY